MKRPDLQGGDDPGAASAGAPAGAAMALETRDGGWPLERLEAAVAQAAQALRDRGVRVLATLLDNGPAWVVADRAARRAGVVHVPLPGFFTPAQWRHAIGAAGVDTVWVASDATAAVGRALAEGGVVARADGGDCVRAAQPERAGADLLKASPTSPDTATVSRGWRAERVPLPQADVGHVTWLQRTVRPVALPAGTATITFTSGSTGTPKGVCLSDAGLSRVASGIGEATAWLGIERHLCALPLAVLLEHVAGLLAPLQRGATSIVLPLKDVGVHGAAHFEPARLQAAVQAHDAHSVIVLPQMLRAWVAWLRTERQRAPARLRLVAVGGAAVGSGLLAAAHAVGLPACEGYGLSEGGSVQTLNLPGAERLGSAGRVLPHAALRIAADGEIEIGGTLFLGYLGQAEPPGAWWPTGDLGRLDDDGYLRVSGRKKTVLITGYGRNVSPEWVETALHDAWVDGLPPIAQAVVLGEGQAALSAVLWPTRPGLPEAQQQAVLQAAVDAANATLPDYAQVRRWVRAQAAFSADTGLATPNGRPQRAAIEALHRGALQEPAMALG